MTKMKLITIDDANNDIYSDTISSQHSIKISSYGITLKHLKVINGDLIITHGGFYAPNLLEVTGKVIFGTPDKLFVDKTFSFGHQMSILNNLRKIGGDLITCARCIKVEMKNLTTVGGDVYLHKCNKLKIPKLIVHNNKPAFKDI